MNVLEWRHAVSGALDVSWSRPPRMSDYAPATLRVGRVRVTVTASGTVTVRENNVLIAQWRGALPEPEVFALAVRGLSTGDTAPMRALEVTP